jgi:hypothetical protein
VQRLRELRFNVDHHVAARPCGRQPQGHAAPQQNTTSAPLLSIKFLLQVTILKEGVHSGSSSGVVPSSFRIVRQLLSRIEDEESGK